jgi:peptidoglycan hydrolase-like protein with peptidoglycan-binding domain
MAGVAVVAGGAVAIVAATQHSAAAPPTSTTGGLGTSTVVRTTLTNVDQVSGTLGYSGSYTISAATPGTLTALPASGTVVQRGGVLAEVDGVPEYLFYGTRPEWRTLQAGVADGADVYQLDQNLIALGYGAGLTPSNTFGSADTAAIERWQTARGVTANGIVPEGSVLYLAGPVRIGTHRVEPGAQAGPGAVLADATDPTRIVSIALDTAKEGELKVGDAVDVQLPNGHHTPGTVGAIANTITAPASGGGGGGGGGGNGTIAVTVAVPDQAALGTLEGAPVTLSITTASADNVLTVPITALVVNPDGSYAVDVEADGATNRVNVTTGLFTDTSVEVTGDLHAGETVVVAST